ncbi:hypothetical protein J4G52_25185 [Burkholderia cenocepacia]|uniref:hypothetical protein n=1 Tax=Burkholderia cenocepacia TaxID=95486 RepID=UPI001AA0FE2C|nr:hypothetical protein [Burkholderia cenocepacia]MBO1856837.1 hypothetical protein [Burkholderia cenocepacia]
MNDSQKKIADQADRLYKLMDGQVRRSVDFVRGTQAWKEALDEVPRDVIARVLGEVLSSGKYQLTPRCRCCRCCGH